MRSYPPGVLIIFGAALASLVGCSGGDEPTSTDPGDGAGGVVGQARAGLGHFVDAPERTAPRPTRLALAPDGAVFLSDTAASRVVGVRDGITFVALVDLDRPIGLALHGDHLYVGSAGRGAVDVYSLSARAYSHSLGGGAGAFGLPNDIAIAPDGEIYVADSRANVVRVFTPEGAPVRTIGELGDGPAQLRFPSSLAVDGRHVFVGDQGNHRVQVYDRAGGWVRSFGKSVETEAHSVRDVAGRFTRIQGLALGADRLFVLDSFHAHVQVIDFNGVSRGFIGRPGQCERCLGLGLDLVMGRNGRLLVADPDHRRWVSLPSVPEVTP